MYINSTQPLSHRHRIIPTSPALEHLPFLSIRPQPFPFLLVMHLNDPDIFPSEPDHFEQRSKLFCLDSKPVVFVSLHRWPLRGTQIHQTLHRDQLPVVQFLCRLNRMFAWTILSPAPVPWRQPLPVEAQIRHNRWQSPWPCCLWVSHHHLSHK